MHALARCGAQTRSNACSGASSELQLSCRFFAAKSSTAQPFVVRSTAKRQ